MDIAQLLLACLSVAFGLWAGVVAWGVRRISAQLESIGEDLRTEAQRLNLYIVQTETRLAVLETKNNIARKS